MYTIVLYDTKFIYFYLQFRSCPDPISLQMKKTNPIEINPIVGTYNATVT